MRVSAAILTVLALTVALAAQAPPPGHLERNLAVVRDAAQPQPARDDAARRLAALPAPEARAALAAALADIANPGAQLAAARALSDNPDAPAELIDPLFAALGSARPLNDAVVRALASYRGNADVLARLVALASGRRDLAETVRIAAIAALASFPEKRAAETLVAVVASPDSAPALRAAAADALGSLAGPIDLNGDAERWAAWWAAQQDVSDEQFRARLLTRRAVLLDRQAAQASVLGGEVESFIKEQYLAAAAAAREAMLTRLMRSPAAEMRLQAPRLVIDDFNNGRGIVAPVRDQLRALLVDPSPRVRLVAAEAIRVINDPPALQILLQQLAVEDNPEVRAALASALAPINNPAVADVLASLLDDPSMRVARSAALALRGLGTQIREADETKAAFIARRLQETMLRRTAPDQDTALREACVDAIAPLRQTAVVREMARMLTDRAETTRTRIGVLRALAELGDPADAPLVVATLRDEDPVVRLEGVRAIARVGAAANADALWSQTLPSVEPDAAVRDAAWNALSAVVDALEVDTLLAWSAQVSDDPRKLVLILRTAAERRGGDPERRAATLARLAAAYEQLSAPADAARFYGDAIRLMGPSTDLAALAAAKEGLVRSLLATRQYEQAVEAAASAVEAGPDAAAPLPAMLVEEARRLRAAGEGALAAELIGQALRSEPPLPPSVIADLQRLNDADAPATRPATAPAGAAVRPVWLSIVRPR